MRAKVTFLRVLVAAVLVLAPLSEVFAGQARSDRQTRSQMPDTSNPNNRTGNTDNNSGAASGNNSRPSASTPGDIQPGVGNTAESVAARQVPWGWLLTGVIAGFIIGLAVSPRRRYTVERPIDRTVEEEIRRNRAA
jgi:hypothetical protein